MEKKKDYLPASEQPLEEIKESLMLQKLSWIFKTARQKKNENILTSIKEKLFPISHPDKPNFDYNELTKYEKKQRVLLALEKLNSANHHLFPENEKRILTTTRVGIPQKVYFFTVNGINTSWLLWTLSSKTFCKRNVLMLSLFTFSNVLFLQSFPLRFKEGFRRIRGRRLAAKYLEKEKYKMDKFVKILNPFVNHHYLEHFKFD